MSGGRSSADGARAMGMGQAWARRGAMGGDWPLGSVASRTSKRAADNAVDFGFEFSGGPTN